MTDRKASTPTRTRPAAGDGRAAGENRIEGLRDRAADAYDGARDKAIDAYDAARDSAASNVAAAPFAALGAGLAVGALLAALLPRTVPRIDCSAPSPTASAPPARPRSTPPGLPDATSSPNSISLAKPARAWSSRSSTDSAKPRVRRAKRRWARSATRAERCANPVRKSAN